MNYCEKCKNVLHNDRCYFCNRTQNKGYCKNCKSYVNELSNINLCSRCHEAQDYFTRVGLQKRKLQDKEQYSIKKKSYENKKKLEKENRERMKLMKEREVEHKRLADLAFEERLKKEQEDIKNKLLTEVGENLDMESLEKYILERESNTYAPSISPRSSLMSFRIRANPEKICLSCGKVIYYSFGYERCGCN